MLDTILNVGQLEAILFTCSSSHIEESHLSPQSIRQYPIYFDISNDNQIFYSFKLKLTNQVWHFRFTKDLFMLLGYVYM